MMPDMEKVISGLEHCTSFDDGRDKFGGVGKCGGCPYYGHDCTDRMKKDALALLKEDCHNCKLECLLQKYDQLKEKYDKLLKEQEAVEPRVSTAEQRCGHCNKVIEMDGWQSCPWCGKRIDWKGWWKKNGTRNQDS